MRIVFLGTPGDAVPPLRALHEAGHEIAFVVTQPDRRRQRGRGSDPTPVKAAAAELGLPVRTPERAREVIDDVRTSDAQLGVVVAFGQLLPSALLEALPHGFVNVHFSLLPRWRGAAPVERAILAGDRDTGVCLMRIDAGLDTGPVYECARTRIGDDETAGELRHRLVGMGTDLLVEHLPWVPVMEPVPQVGEPTYADKLDIDEFRVDWTQPAVEIARLVRAGNPRPGAWTIANGRRLKILRASPATEPAADHRPGTVLPGARVVTGKGALELVEVQPEGKGHMSYESWVAGHRDVSVLGKQ